jgi:hypothetical protein
VTAAAEVSLDELGMSDLGHKELAESGSLT